jgi:hypothetical protein
MASISADYLLIVGSRSLNPTVAELDVLITVPPDRVICGGAPGVESQQTSPGADLQSRIHAATALGLI